ncbi:hypothetical protein EFM12_05350, partial [Latilactobacillus curvatus]|nr:hypothetical protein [Latilactobacillus curvatus]
IFNVLEYLVNIKTPDIGFWSNIGGSLQSLFFLNPRQLRGQNAILIGITAKFGSWKSSVCHWKHARYLNIDAGGLLN